MDDLNTPVEDQARPSLWIVDEKQSRFGRTFLLHASHLHPLRTHLQHTPTRTRTHAEQTHCLAFPRAAAFFTCENAPSFFPLAPSFPLTPSLHPLFVHLPHFLLTDKVKVLQNDQTIKKRQIRRSHKNPAAPPQRQKHLSPHTPRPFSLTPSLSITQTTQHAKLAKTTSPSTNNDRSGRLLELLLRRSLRSLLRWHAQKHPRIPILGNPLLRLYPALPLPHLCPLRPLSPLGQSRLGIHVPSR